MSAVMSEEHENVRSAIVPILPPSYHLELKLPVIFFCTRIGELGSALYLRDSGKDEVNPSLSQTDVRKLCLFSQNPTAEKILVAAGRKFLVTKARANWAHGRCLTSVRHRGGILVTRLGCGYTLVCIYEGKSKHHDVLAISIEIEKKLGKTHAQ